MKKIYILILVILYLPNNSFAQNYGTPGYYGERIRSRESALASIWAVGKYGGTDGFDWNSKHKKNVRKRPARMTPMYPITTENLVAEMTKDTETGQTTIRWNNGAVYVGEINYGEISGTGTMIYPDSSKYQGQWKNDRFHGVGTIEYADGSAYCGQWENGDPNGQGTFLTPEGVKYTAEFKDGKPRGKCIIQDKDGRLYSARWVRGVLKEKSIKPLKEKK